MVIPSPAALLCLLLAATPVVSAAKALPAVGIGVVSVLPAAGITPHAAVAGAMEDPMACVLTSVLVWIATIATHVATRLLGRQPSLTSRGVLRRRAGAVSTEGW